MSLFVSSGAFIGVHHVNELIPLCHKYGVEGVELASGLRAGGDLLEKIGESDSLDFLLHNYFPAPQHPFVLNLADADEENRLRSVEFCEDALGICAEVGIPFYSVHAGFATSLRAEDLGRPDRQCIEVTEEDYRGASERFVTSVTALEKQACELGIQLLLENNVHAVPGSAISHLLMVTADDICDFFESFASESIGLLLDVAHLKVSSFHREFDVYEAVRRVSPWIKALHLSENEEGRDTNDPCRAESWFWEPLNEFCNEPIPAVLESYRLSELQITEQVELVSNRLACLSN